MQSVSTITYPDKIRLRVPRGLHAALQLAARQHHTTASEWARQALIRSLELDGVRLRDGAAETAEFLAKPSSDK